MNVLSKTNVIYVIRNESNGKFYVGSSGNYNKRILYHFGELKNKIHANWALQEDWDKYGQDVFSSEVIEQCSGDLQMREDFWIAELNSLYPSGYNLRYAGNTGKLSDISKQKVSKALSGKSLPNEVKKKISNSSKKSHIKEKEVSEILKLLNSRHLKRREIAEMFNTTIYTIDAIRSGKHWVIRDGLLRNE